MTAPHHLTPRPLLQQQQHQQQVQEAPCGVPAVVQQQQVTPPAQRTPLPMPRSRPLTMKRRLVLRTSTTFQHLSKTIPQDVKDAVIVTVFKKKVSNVMYDNNKGVSVFAVAGKMLTKITYNLYTLGQKLCTLSTDGAC